jgi:hypothetical protein
MAGLGQEAPLLSECLSLAVFGLDHHLPWWWRYRYATKTVVVHPLLRARFATQATPALTSMLV